nr:polyketide synthase dehydratase domain-containing protein [Streptomyces clavuligerus]
MPDPAISGGGLVAAGLGTTGHPLLGASVAVAETGELLLTGRISLRTHPWLADHTVSDTTLLPGTAFVELAVRAGDEAGCPVLEELTLQTPLVLPATGGLQLQLRVGAPDGTGRRSVDIFSRPEAAPEVVPAAPSTPSTPPGSAVPSPPSPLSPLGPPSPPGSLDFPDFPWTVHATGVLTREPANEAPPPEDGIWPPPGAEPVDVTGLYERFAAAGHHYGPAFQGIRAAWRRDGEIFTEVGLPQDQHTGAAGFNLHPALLDAALQGLWLTADGSEPDTEKPGTVRLPFSWTGVTLHCVGRHRPARPPGRGSRRGGVVLRERTPPAARWSRRRARGPPRRSGRPASPRAPALTPSSAWSGPVPAAAVGHRRPPTVGALGPKGCCRAPTRTGSPHRRPSHGARPFPTRYSCPAARRGRRRSRTGRRAGTR